MRRQRRQEDVELFQTLHRMKAGGLKVTEMAKELGLNRRRLDRWLRLDALPEPYGFNGGPPSPLTNTYHECRQSIVLPVKLKPSQTYSFVLTSQAFATPDGCPLESYKVEFKTK